MKRYQQITLDVFTKIKAGDQIYCNICGEITLQTAAGDAFYNCNAYAPDWEVETENGFFCWDCVYIPVETPHPFTDDTEKMRDFFELTKDEFLASYSYLTEAEYDATAAAVKEAAQ